MSKEKISFEYEFKSTSPSVLWSYLTTPSGLTKWFCDDLNISGKEYTFIWNKSPQKAELLNVRQGVYIRFRWEEDANTKYYFEFRLNTAELSGTVEIEITDFCEPDEIEDTKELWKSQIETLKRNIGA